MRGKLIIVAGACAVVLAGYAIWRTTATAPPEPASGPTRAAPRKSAPADAGRRSVTRPPPATKRADAADAPHPSKPPTEGPTPRTAPDPSGGASDEPPGKVTREDLKNAESLEELAELLERAGATGQQPE